MKNSIILTALLAFTTVSFAQQTAPNDHWKDSDLYQKSKSQRTAGWIITGAGIAGCVITLAADMSQMTEVTLGRVFGETQQAKSYTVPYVISGAAIVGGMYLLFRSSSNKRKAKAASVFIDIENAPMLQGAVFSYQSFPVAGVRIRL